MNRRVSYSCSELRLVGETQADLDIVSFLSFFILCSCDKANSFAQSKRLTMPMDSHMSV